MRKVITYGTFDMFHKGHYNILKRAKEQGDYLIVGVTGESYDTERGKLSVQDSLAVRIENVRKTGFADQIIVEEYLGQKIPDILKYDVDVLVVGSDWKGKFDHISKYCEVKYLERTKDISSTQLREERLDIYKFGIVTDNLNDNDTVTEPKHVSGIHVESVFCEDEKMAAEFAEKYELDKGYADYAMFLNGVDIVYIKTARKNRAEYVEKALKAKKHVICDAPCTLSIEEEKRLSELADDNEVVFIDNVAILYLQAFGQLLWMSRGNLIGDLVNVKCSISNKQFTGKEVLDFIDLAYYPICTVVKVLGADFDDYNFKIIKDNDGNVSYGVISILYGNSVATIEIGMELDIDCGISILGFDGYINVPDIWWEIGYFTMKNKNEAQIKRYSSNYEGNGFRYLIQALLQRIKSKNENKNNTTQSITIEESEAILAILNSLGKEKA